MKPAIPTAMSMAREPTATTKQIQVWMWGTLGRHQPPQPLAHVGHRD